jgi:hypothetical protein
MFRALRSLRLTLGCSPGQVVDLGKVENLLKLAQSSIELYVTYVIDGFEQSLSAGLYRRHMRCLLIIDL